MIREMIEDGEPIEEVRVNIQIINFLLYIYFFFWKSCLEFWYQKSFLLLLLNLYSRVLWVLQAQ